MKKLFSLTLVLAAFGAHATPAPTDTTAVTAAAQTPAPGAPERPWYRPKHLVLQTGGGLGMVAAGAGYEFAKDRLETDILIGYVPKHYAGSTLSLASLKFMYSPFRLPVGEKIQVVPLTVGAYFSYTHGTINDELKGQYSSDYYWFSTDTRYGPLLGSRLTFLAPPVAATGQPRKISVYYELGSNDLYLASWLNNQKGGLGFGQLLTLALGVKADF
ncbi:hypothetical protein [Hymenobacter properus]|uniref:Outer membrane protein beta-barrel domain-containing protein n=1 Tax=Hymenobacter properus TaxID=2791026 RepID=A0A931FJJ4_9BACT|nr:hypothetical protein [Hymenobacter properus]MBF9141958.1 hypothetical protein [Hymenobacter properus]MBR7720765.1 hypothetical protein [Microvirga sp. SRT04]